MDSKQHIVMPMIFFSLLNEKKRDCILQLFFPTKY